jgi:hypothetical protein
MSPGKQRENQRDGFGYRAWYAPAMKMPMFARFGFGIGLTASLVLAWSVRAQQTSPNWHTFTDATGRFSFLVPSEPKRQTQKDESHQEGPIVTDTYVANTESSAFIAGLTQYPPAAVLPDQDELTADRDNFNKQVNATVVSEQRRDYSGFPAIEFKSKSEQNTFHALMVKADHRVYCTVTVYKTPDEPVECTRFVNSLKLIKP